MDKIEIETIQDAIILKQTWVKKSLDDFLNEWAKITKDHISGHQKMEIYRYGQEQSSRLVLNRGQYYIEIEHNHYDAGWEEDTEEYFNLENHSIWEIKKAIKNINAKLHAYFKNIQADIDSMSEAGEQIAAITEKLK